MLMLMLMLMLMSVAGCPAVRRSVSRHVDHVAQQWRSLLRRKEIAVLSLSAAALLMVGGGNAHAGEGPKFQNNTQILSCVTLEVLDIPIASAANNNVDCSMNSDTETHEWSAGEPHSDH
jgi:hypothetical protein